MKRITKKTLAIMLAFIMVFGSAPLAGFTGITGWFGGLTANAVEYAGVCGEYLTWTLDTSTGILNIKGTGDMYDWADISTAPWFPYKSQILSVTIGSNVTSIGSLSFFSYSNLASATIGNGVTRIGGYAFYECVNLTFVMFGNSLISIGMAAFAHCEKLASVIIPNSVTGIGIGAFAFCAELESVIIGDGVDIIGDEAFKECTGLINLAIGESVESIGTCAFSNCISLASITFPESVTSIGEYAFSRCISLEIIAFPESVTSIDSAAFHKCTALTSVMIPESVSTIGYCAFCQCDALENITVDDKNQHYSSDETGVLFDKNKKTLIQYTIGNTSEAYEIPGSVQQIEDYSFCQGMNLTKVTMPTSLIGIGQCAFASCENLSDITIPGGTKSIGLEAFYGCISFVNITIPSSVTSLGGGAFKKCTGLKKVTIGTGVQSIKGNTFYDCSKLSDVKIGTGVQSIESNSFYGCSSLMSITIPSSVTNIGGGAFTRCIKLSRITVNTANQHYSNDSYGVLFNKNKTYLIQYPVGNSRRIYTIPDSVTSIRSSAFSEGGNLTSVIIPDSVTNIQMRAFYDCSGLIRVTIGRGVTHIDIHAFNGCAALTDVYYCGTESQWNAITIGFGNEPLTSATIHFSSDITEGLCGDDLMWELDTLTGSLVISGTGDMYDWSYDAGAPWSHHSSEIENVTIEDGATSIGSYAFYGCGGLANITIPADVTKIEDYAFNGCAALTDIYYSGTESQWNAITIGDGNEPLTSATIHFSSDIVEGLCGDNLTWMFDVSTGELDISGVGDMHDWSFYDRPPWFPYKQQIEEVKIDDSVTNIGSYAFGNCFGLTNITIPDSVSSIGDYAFFDCSALIDITIPDSVSSMGQGVFNCCFALTDITVDSANQHYSSDENGVLFNKDKTILIQYPTGKTNTTFYIPADVTRIEGWAFSNCISLTSITIPNSVTSMGDCVFSGCTGLTNVVIGNKIKNIGEGTFSGCTGLTDIIIPDNVLSIGDWVFSDCDGLTSVIIGNGVESIGEGAFCGCDSLTSITIPNSLTSIERRVFWGCTDLTIVTIPDSVTQIKEYSFYNCVGISDVYYSGTESQWNAITIDDGNEPLTSATIHFNNVVHVTGVSLDEESLSLTVSETSQLTAEVLPSDATDKSVTWDSSDTDVATVDENGLVTAVAPGTATVTVTTNDGGFTDTCEVTVKIHIHTYISNVTVVPTCTTPGVMTYTCTECGDSYTESIPAIGHDWGDWISDGNETSHTRVCANDESHTETEACTWVETDRQEPTTTEDGWIDYECSVCGQTKRVVIPQISAEVLWAAHGKIESSATGQSFVEDDDFIYIIAKKLGGDGPVKVQLRRDGSSYLTCTFTRTQADIEDVQLYGVPCELWRIEKGKIEDGTYIAIAKYIMSQPINDIDNDTGYEFVIDTYVEPVFDGRVFDAVVEDLDDNNSIEYTTGGQVMKFYTALDVYKIQLLDKATLGTITFTESSAGVSVVTGSYDGADCLVWTINKAFGIGSYAFTVNARSPLGMLDSGHELAFRVRPVPVTPSENAFVSAEIDSDEITLGDQSVITVITCKTATKVQFVGIDDGAPVSMTLTKDSYGVAWIDNEDDTATWTITRTFVKLGTTTWGIRVLDNGVYTPVYENAIIYTIIRSQIERFVSASIDDESLPIPVGTESTVTVVTHFSATKIQFIDSATGATWTISKTSPAVKDIIIDNVSGTATWTIKNKFVVGVYDFNVKVFAEGAYSDIVENVLKFKVVKP